MAKTRKKPPVFPTPPPPHPDSARLARGVGRCSRFLGPWKGIAYRIASTARANKEDLLTGIGSRITGGRWTPLGAFSAIYLSHDEATATAEFHEGNRRRGLPRHVATPYVVTSVVVEMARVLDLSNSDVRIALGVTLRAITGEPWFIIQETGQEALTQAIARLVRAAGVQGILAPSAPHKGGVNLVVFPDNLRPGDHRLEVVNPDKLPPEMLP